MPGGNKRAAEESTESSTKASKVARTEKNGGAKTSSKKAPAKAALSTAEFKAKALPLHVNLTHTPPSIQKEGAIDSEGKEEKAVDTSAGDVGFIGNLTLVPSTFSTGSYGWKGSKRITVELQGGDTDGEGGKEKVQIMLSINATVVGSKPGKAAKGKRGRKGKKVEEEEEEEEEGEDAEDDEAE